MSSPPHMTNIKALVETGPIAEGEARRSGGRAARLAKRTAPMAALAPIEYGIDPYRLMGDSEAEKIHAAAGDILEQVGIEFRLEAALSAWAKAGADVKETRVRIPRALLEKLITKLPSRFTLGPHEIGLQRGLFAPAEGAGHVMGLEGTRAPATKDDLSLLLKLVQQSPELHLTSANLCLPKGMSPQARLCEMFHLSDKPFLAPAGSGTEAKAALAMTRIRHGETPMLIAPIRARSPLVYEAGPLEALITYVEAGQACILSPFALAGATSPASIAGTLAQLHAETLAGLAFTQILRPGSAHLYGPQVQAVAMRSGAPMGGTAEAAQFTLLFGQMARHLNLPFKASGAISGAKLADAQSGYEANLMLQAAVASRAQLITQAAGQLEAGETICMAKLLLDASELAGWHKYARGVSLNDLDTAMKTLAQVGPQSHFLGTAHTLANFERAFHMPALMDFGPHEQWEAEGARDAAARAREQARWSLQAFTPPALDADTSSALMKAAET